MTSWSNPPPPSPTARAGCLTVLAGILVGGAWWAYSPDSPPAGGFLVDARERTYLEAEPAINGFEVTDTHWSVNIYYTQVGGWFNSTRRMPWMTIPLLLPATEPREQVPPVTYTRLPPRPDSIQRIAINDVYVFEKPPMFPSQASIYK